jgi:RHS repeat-associated protein
MRGGGGALAASLDAAGTMEYYLYDGCGDVRQIVDASGAVTKAYAYDAFGNEGSPGPGDTNPFRYAGEYLDLETDAYCLRARNYDPATSRMLSEYTHWNPSNMIYGDCPVRNSDCQRIRKYDVIPEVVAED